MEGTVNLPARCNPHRVGPEQTALGVGVILSEHDAGPRRPPEVKTMHETRQIEAPIEDHASLFERAPKDIQNAVKTILQLSKGDA